MRRLAKWMGILVVIGAASWSAFWYAGARGQEAGVAAWLDAQRQRGWQAEAASVVVDGFPFDFRLTASDLAVTDPRTAGPGRPPRWSRGARPTSRHGLR